MKVKYDFPHRGLSSLFLLSFLAFFLALPIQNLYAQTTPIVEWTKTFGGTASDTFDFISPTDDGGYVIGGKTASSGNGGNDLWVIKIDGSGNEEASATFGGSCTDNGSVARQTTDGGYIVAGQGDKCSSSQSKAYMLKLDDNLVMQWEKKYGDSGYNLFYDVVESDDQQFAASGYAQSSATHYTDGLFVKYDPVTDTEILSYHENLNYENLHNIENTQDGGFVMGGTTQPASSGGTGLWLLKLDALGNEDVNVSHSRPDTVDAHFRTIQTQDGQYYMLAGARRPVSSGIQDALITRLDSSGEIVWQEEYGGTNTDDLAYRMIESSDGKFVVVGYTTNNANGGMDAWIFKIDAQKNILWEITVGGANEEQAMSVVETTDGGYLVAGRTYSYGAGGADGWLIKLSTDYPPACTLQDPYETEWATYNGDTGDDSIHKIRFDSEGNFYSIGQHTPVTPSSGNDVVLVKYSPDGTEIWKQLIGGSSQDFAQGLAVDANDHIYVVGATYSDNFSPLTSDAYQASLSSPGQADGFIVKYHKDGTLLYSSYFGTTAYDDLSSIEIADDGRIFVTGSTADGTIATNGWDVSYNGGTRDAYLGEITPNGRPVWISLYGGGSNDALYDIEIDSQGYLVMSGNTSSSTLPATLGNGFDSFGGGQSDGLIAKFSPVDGQPVWSLYLGGSAYDQLFTIDLDANDIAYSTGYTQSGNFPVVNGEAFHGDHDIILVKVNTAGDVLFSGSLGTAGSESAIGLKLDEEDHIFILGTSTGGFPAAENDHNGGYDAVMIKLSNQGTILLSQYLGGSGNEEGRDIAMIGDDLIVNGFTESSDFPVVNADDPSYNGGVDSFFARLNDTSVKADAGVDQSVPEGTIVTLDGSGSRGVDLVYSWEQIAGPEVSLDTSDPVHPFFEAPLVPQGGKTITFQLIVSNECDTSEPDTVEITVINVNNVPVADAGDFESQPECSVFTLDGSNSYDLDNEPLSCEWTQPEGTIVIIDDPLACVTSLTAPCLVPVEGETLTFSLVVYDGIDFSDPDTVDKEVTHVNQPPVADAGGPGPITYDEFSTVTLDGSGSFDPENDPLDYEWVQTAGSTVIIQNADQAIATFEAPAVMLNGEDFTFVLTVTEAQTVEQYSDDDPVIIHVQNINDPPNCGDAQSSTGKLWPPNHKMKLISINNLADPQSDDVNIDITAVTQDEPVNGLGDGDTSPDAVINSDGPQQDKVYIRSERSGTGNGRVYEVHFTASDEHESCSGSVNVTVPHSRKSTAIDDGQVYDSLVE